MPTPSAKKVTSIIPARCVWGLLCTLSAVDQERNNISLFNIIEQVNLPPEFFIKKEGLVVIPVPHEIVLLWRRVVNIGPLNENLTCDFKIKLVDPKGVILAEHLASLQLAPNTTRSRFRLRTNGLPITIPGDYVYQVEIKKTDIADFEKTFEIPFVVTKK